MFFPCVELFEAEGALSLSVVGPSLLPVLAEVGAIGEGLSAGGAGVVPLGTLVPDQAHLVFVLVVGLQLQAGVEPANRQDTGYFLYILCNEKVL